MKNHHNCSFYSNNQNASKVYNMYYTYFSTYFPFNLHSIWNRTFLLHKHILHGIWENKKLNVYMWHIPKKKKTSPTFRCYFSNKIIVYYIQYDLFIWIVCVWLMKTQKLNLENVRSIQLILSLHWTNTCASDKNE